MVDLRFGTSTSRRFAMFWDLRRSNATEEDPSMAAHGLVIADAITVISLGILVYFLDNLKELLKLMLLLEVYGDYRS